MRIMEVEAAAGRLPAFLYCSTCIVAVLVRPATIMVAPVSLRLWVNASMPPIITLDRTSGRETVRNTVSRPGPERPRGCFIDYIQPVEGCGNSPDNIGEYECRVERGNHPESLFQHIKPVLRAPE